MMLFRLSCAIQLWDARASLTGQFEGGRNTSTNGSVVKVLEPSLGQFPDHSCLSSFMSTETGHACVQHLACLLCVGHVFTGIIARRTRLLDIRRGIVTVVARCIRRNGRDSR